MSNNIHVPIKQQIALLVAVRTKNDIAMTFLKER